MKNVCYFLFLITFLLSCEKEDLTIVENSVPSVNNTNDHPQIDALYQRWYENSEIEDTYLASSVGDPTPCFEKFIFLMTQKFNGKFIPIGGIVGDLFFNLLYEPEQSRVLEILLDRLDDIMISIKALQQQVKLGNYDAAFREKETMYINIQTSTLETWKLLKDIDSDKTLTGKEKGEKRTSIINKWGELNLNGAGNSRYATINFIKKILSPAAEQKTYFEIYDLYASNYFGFEFESFKWRENCRDRDVALIIPAVTLSVLYQEINKLNNERETLKSTFNTFYKYHNTNKVDYVNYYQNNHNKCYIAGIEGRNYRKDIYQISYDFYTTRDGLSKIRNITRRITKIDAIFTHGSNMENINATLMNIVMSNGWNPHDGTKYPNLSTQKELRLIYDFYNKRSKENLSLEHILSRNGFIIKKDNTAKEFFLLTSNGFTVDQDSPFNNNKILSFKTVRLDHTSFEEVNKARLGISWNKNDHVFIKWDTQPNPAYRFFGLYY